jgi:hypothetical protein
MELPADFPYTCILTDANQVTHVAQDRMVDYVTACGEHEAPDLRLLPLGAAPITCIACREALRGPLGYLRKDQLRRSKLIEKQYSGFTDEEEDRPGDPAWDREVKRRLRFNLTAAQERELDRLHARHRLYRALVEPRGNSERRFMSAQVEQIDG